MSGRLSLYYIIIKHVSLSLLTFVSSILKGSPISLSHCTLDKPAKTSFIRYSDYYKYANICYNSRLTTTHE